MIFAARPDWSSIDLDAPIIVEAEPDASLETLTIAEWWTRAIAAAPYAGTLRIFDSTAQATTRRIGIMVAPACKLGRWYGSRYGYGTGVQTQSKVSNGSLTIYSVTQSPIVGTQAFAPLVKQGGIVGEIVGGEDTDTANGNAALIEVTEGLASALVELEVQQLNSFVLCIIPGGQTDDLETL
jgi:hypothetical protein